MPLNSVTQIHQVDNKEEIIERFLNKRIDNVINKAKCSAFSPHKENNSLKNIFQDMDLFEIRFRREDLINMVKPLFYSDLLYNTLSSNSESLIIETVNSFSFFAELSEFDYSVDSFDLKSNFLLIIY